MGLKELVTSELKTADIPGVVLIFIQGVFSACPPFDRFDSADCFFVNKF
jgi:hypothetical protein